MRSGDKTGVSQGGSVLLISLMMLIVVTLVGISMIRLTTTNLQLVNNMQGRHHALAAASDVLNEVLSASFINEDDVNAALDAVANATYTYSPEGTDSSAKTYAVTVSKPCLKTVLLLKNSEIGPLMATNAAYKTCIATGIWSTCYRSHWQFTASVRTGFLGSSIDLTQGAEIILSQTAGILVGSTTNAYYCAS